MKRYPLPSIVEVDLGEHVEQRPVVLLTQSGAWQAVQVAGLRLDVVWQDEPKQATEKHFAALAAAVLPLAQQQRAPVIYAVGGGLAADAGKYVASKTGLPLVVVPTALSVDAYLTWASGVRHDGCVRYIETGPAHTVLVDYKVLAGAPAHLRAAGICDLLSIATGLWDWRYAEAQGCNPPDQHYLPWAGAVAQSILEQALHIAPSAGRGDRQGLQALLGLMALEVQLCNLLGHSRPEEGSEHYLAYALEHHPAVGTGHPHGDLVGPCILAIAAVQDDQDLPLLEAALEAAGVRLDRISPQAMSETLQQLGDYVRYHHLPYGIAWMM